MGLGRQADQQRELLLSFDELPRSQGHASYDRLQEVLRSAGFDRHVEGVCAPHYWSASRGRRSLPPRRYFRLLLVGYFEGIDSERGIERLVEHGLIKGERIGVDASTMEANAALRAIVRRHTGWDYREMLKRMARPSGIETRMRG
jgi:transposase